MFANMAAGAAISGVTGSFAPVRIQGISAGRNSYTSLYKGVVTNDKAGRWQNVSKETLHKMIMGNYTQDLGRNFFGGVGDYMYDMGKELYQIDGYYGKARDNLYRFSRIVGSIE